MRHDSQRPDSSGHPRPRKPFEVFVADDSVCRQFAEHQTGTSPQSAAAQKTLTGAAIGTAAGALAGAAIGAAAGHPGIGAGVGTGTGLLIGTGAGANTGYEAGFTLQRQYNIAYEQCITPRETRFQGLSRRVLHHGPPQLRFLLHLQRLNQRQTTPFEDKIRFVIAGFGG